MALDPQSVEAQSLVGDRAHDRVLDGMTDSAAADIARAEGLVGQALAASPRSPLAHFAKGQVLRAQRRFEEAIPEYETVIAFNRNWVGALATLGQCKFLTGSIEETIPLEEQAIRLSPRDPCIGIWYLPDWARASAAIAHRRGDPLARKGAQRQSGTSRTFTPGSPPPMPSKARPNAPPPNSPKPAG